MTDGELSYEYIRKESKKSLFFFARAILNFKDLTRDLHLPFANYLQLFPWNGGPPASRRKMLVVPREHFKSTLASVALPLWLLLHDRQRTIGLCSAVIDNSVKWLRAIKSVVQNNTAAAFRSRNRVTDPANCKAEMENMIT